MKNNETQMSQNNDFDGLVAHIQQTQDVLQNNARLVINRHVTAKAWLTGYYIVEYEQKGADRAKYGEQLLKSLSERLGKKMYSVTTLKIYRQFYQVYSHLDKEVAGFLLSQSQIGQSVTDQFGGVAVSNKIAPLAVKSNLLFNKLSFTHLVAILPITDPLERAFYETMAIRGTWSVRELQRQIPTIISAVDGVKSLRRWLSWWMARLRQIRSPLTSSRHLPLSSWVCKLAYYRKNIMQPDDNPPIGILLCSAVGREMAEYSLLDLDESVFISKYQLNVPSKERMTEFLRKENEGLYNKV